MKILALIAAAVLSACTTAQPVTVDQSLYAALGTYGVAVSAAADYAQSPSANRAIVDRLNAVNRAPATRATVRYARAYVLCEGSTATRPDDPTLDCSIWDFRPTTVTSAARDLRSVITLLGAR